MAFLEEKIQKDAVTLDDNVTKKFMKKVLQLFQKQSCRKSLMSLHVDGGLGMREFGACAVYYSVLT